MSASGAPVAAIVLAGDSHTSWSNKLYDDAGTLVGRESGCTTIASPSYGSLLPGLGALLAQINREVVFCDQEAKGYTLLTLTPGAAIAEHVAASTIFAKPFEHRILARHRVAAGRREGIAPVEMGSKDRPMAATRCGTIRPTVMVNLAQRLGLARQA